MCDSSCQHRAVIGVDKKCLSIIPLFLYAKNIAYYLIRITYYSDIVLENVAQKLIKVCPTVVKGKLEKEKPY